MNNQKQDTFSIAAIANVSGKCRQTIYYRACAMGINNKAGLYTADQAYDLVYYNRKKPVYHRETLEQETARLIKTMAKMNERLGRKTVIAA